MGQKWVKSGSEVGQIWVRNGSDMGQKRIKPSFRRCSAIRLLQQLRCRCLLSILLVTRRLGGSEMGQTWSTLGQEWVKSELNWVKHWSGMG